LPGERNKNLFWRWRGSRAPVGSDRDGVPTCIRAERHFFHRAEYPIRDLIEPPPGLIVVIPVRVRAQKKCHTLLPEGDILQSDGVDLPQEFEGMHPLHGKIELLRFGRYCSARPRIRLVRVLLAVLIAVEVEPYH